MAREKKAGDALQVVAAAVVVAGEEASETRRGTRQRVDSGRIAGHTLEGPTEHTGKKKREGGKVDKSRTARRL
jgi:hypothetical protein